MIYLQIYQHFRDGINNDFPVSLDVLIPFAFRINSNKTPLDNSYISNEIPNISFQDVREGYLDLLPIRQIKIRGGDFATQYFKQQGDTQVMPGRERW